jgi:hypothetical protein
MSTGLHCRKGTAASRVTYYYNSFITRLGVSNVIRAMLRGLKHRKKEKEKSVTPITYPK